MIFNNNPIDELSNADLHAVLAHHGMKKAKTQNDKESTYYFCPFCKDSTKPHFRVSNGNRRGGLYNAVQFSCYELKITGYGAIELEARLSGLSTTGADYLKILSNLSEILKTPLPELDDNSRNGYISECNPQNEFTLELMADFTPEALQILGCKLKRMYKEETGNRTAKVHNDRPVFLYSFGPNFNKKSADESNFETKRLQDEFGLYQVKSYTLPKQWNDGKEISIKRESHALFPIFAFVYYEESPKKKKAQWGQIFQPNWHDGDTTGRANFFFYRDGLTEYSVNRKLLGDMVSNKVFGGDLPVHAVKSQKTGEQLTTTYIKTVGEGKDQVEMEADLDDEDIRVENILLCKDGINAINAYYHLNSIRHTHSYNPNLEKIFYHVVWMADNMQNFEPYMFAQLKKLGTNKFLMFDIDNMGKKKAFQICKRFNDFRMALLPEVLKESPAMFVGGQHIPCRDIRSFFMNYNLTEDEQGAYDKDINLMLLSKLTAALPNQPLIYSEKRDKKTNKMLEYFYKLDLACIWQFMATEGYCREVESGSADRIGKYARIDRCFVSYFDNKSILAATLETLVGFAQRIARPGTEDFRKMSNAILPAKDINEKTAVTLPVMDIDYRRGYGPKLDYFFYRNGALRITPDNIEFVSYNEIDFHVNTAQILPFDFEMPCGKDNPPFTLSLNPEYETWKQRIAEMEENPECSRSMIDKEKAELMTWSQTHKWIFDFKGKEVKEWWEPLQVIRCFANQDFEKEEDLLRKGEQFSEEDERLLRARMANLLYSLGRPLFRYKDGGTNYFPYITENKVEKEGECEGGSGKSSFANTFMACAGKVLEINARNIDKDGDFHLLLAKYMHHEHRVIHWEDYRKGLDLGPLFNYVTSGFQYRQRHKDEIRVDLKDSPGHVVTSNYQLKLDSPSESGRIILTGFSSRFNRGDEKRKVAHRKISDVMPGFRKNPEDINLKSRSQMAYICAIGVQFCMNTDEKVLANMDMLYERSRTVSLGKAFKEWVEDFFSKPYIYNCPIDLDTIFSDYVEYCESSEDKKDKFAPITFKGKLEDYCREFNLVMLPDVCLNSKTNRDIRYMRTKAWCKVSYFSDPKVWEKDDKVEFRVLKHSTKVLFFCKKGEEPNTFEEVKDLCREYYTQPDPEPILDMDDNPITGLTLDQQTKWQQHLNRKQGNYGGGYNAPTVATSEPAKTGEAVADDLPF